MFFILGILLLCFALAPFPLGLGMIYPIRDRLRGHPQVPHGTRPPNFAGLWIREETVMYDFLGQAFYLTPDGRFEGMGGMTVRRWHFDNGSLFVDSVSRCGNCYRGNVTGEYTTKFLNPDQLFITNRVEGVNRGIAGKYRRVAITDALKTELSRLQKSDNEGESFKGHFVLEVIKRFERLPKLQP